VRPHGLYYPYFRIRDDRWLKVMALYWPKIVRLVPPHLDDMHQPSVSRTVQVLIEELDLIERLPAGASVQAAGGMFLDVVARPSLAPLRYFHTGTRIDPTIAKVSIIHASEVDLRLRTLLSDYGFADQRAGGSLPEGAGYPMEQSDGPTAMDWAEVGFPHWA